MNTDHFETFEKRHNSSDSSAISAMLRTVKTSSLSELVKETIPSDILLNKNLSIEPAQSEYFFLQDLKKLAEKNKIFKSYIGMGYYNCIVPNVILRNILENPGWYTAYTPYQAEISQGRLEMLMNFQTMITDLTAMEIANASLLDEATAAAEAMNLLFNIRDKKKNVRKILLDKNIHPQVIDVISTRAQSLNIDISIENVTKIDIAEDIFFGILLQYPNTNGDIINWTELIKKAHKHKIGVAVGTDLLSLTLLKPPGEMRADVVFGSTQRLGLPMGFGGPHAAFFATKEQYKRQIPGRIIGISKDVMGKQAYRMALQTREQHIRRDKATSNICTAQVLPAVMATAYTIWHGEEGLKDIATRVHNLTKILVENLSKYKIKITNRFFFDTIKIQLDDFSTKNILEQQALKQNVNFRYFEDNYIGISLDETTTLEDIKTILNIFHKTLLGENISDPIQSIPDIKTISPAHLKRTTSFLTHPVFKIYHTEHEMLRYLKRMENKDLSLTHNMISLGSCTMKLNATTEMIPLTWAEFSNLHPFIPINQAQGYHLLFEKLTKQLCEITGFKAISFQPNSGAQGEYTGLIIIKAYHKNKGESYRDVVIVPQSAHGTNPASAVMAGMKVVIVKCDTKGNIDTKDLEEKVKLHSNKLAALMITYPSTHGVFEEKIRAISELIHKHKAKVYMDGANMNAQIGLTNPSLIGADVCHLNLHKTFCIPHGGGGPGMGPILVTEELASFLPTHFCLNDGKKTKSLGPVSATAWGSASILTISYAYITMMGAKGLCKASELAILHANYIKERLEKYYQILYTGKNGRVAHEMILDCRNFKEVDVEVEDISKRLMDYGYHAPTISFPVPGTLMIEPTESESKTELDRFCQVMISIREEIQEIQEGKVDKTNNVLKNAPHTIEMLTLEWDKPYSREKAVYPLPYLKESKFWPTVGRIDSAYGDRNLVCRCN